MSLQNRLPRTLLACSRRWSNTHTFSRQVLRHIKQNSTLTPQAGPPKTRFCALCAAGLVLIGAGLGWTLNQERNARVASGRTIADPQIYHTSPGLNDKYGSVEDFKQAIQSLEAILPKDAVSTDPDVLEVHGFSENDYHPGNRDPTSKYMCMLLTRNAL